MPSPNVVASSDYGPIIVNAHDTVVGRNILRTGSWEKNELGLMIKLLEILFKKTSGLLPMMLVRISGFTVSPLHEILEHT